VIFHSSCRQNGCAANAKPETKCGPGNLPACARDFSVHFKLRIDTWVSAALVAVISLLPLIAFRDWKEWIACILGLWIAVSPWVLGFQHTVAMTWPSASQLRT
jgi:hypothetical protein